VIERSPIRPGATKLIARVDRLLDDAYRSPEADLGNQGDPLDEAIYIILSFQTDLARFRRTWRRLCATYSSWEALERAPTRDVSRALRDGGLQRQKATTIKRLLSRVRELSGSLTLDSLKGMSDAEAERLLTHLPGLSWKGARCVLLYSLGRDVFPVDGNTFRILRRVGVLRNGAVYRRKPLHDELQRIVHPERRRSLHVNLVVHGQRACRPTAPHCTTCPLRRVCATNLGSRGPRSRTRS
jgi:endonuclease III